MSSQRKLVISLAVLLCVALFGVSGYFFSVKKQAGTLPGTLSVIYLSSGEIYVGNFTWGKRPQLDNGYLLMKVANEKDPKASDVRLQPLAETIWAPSTLYLNQEHIIFSGPLDPNGAVAKNLRERGVR